MFNFNVNIPKVIRENVTYRLQRRVMMAWLKVYAKPFQIIHAELITRRDHYRYLCTFNGSVIYLETALNDAFDAVNRGIYITDAAYIVKYIYKKTENMTSLILHLKWRVATAYTAGQKVNHVGKLYMAMQNSTGVTPGTNSAFWKLIRNYEYIRMKAEYNGQIAFIVNVPQSVVFDVNKMKALINYYKLAGKGYTILIV